MESQDGYRQVSSPNWATRHDAIGMIAGKMTRQLVARPVGFDCKDTRTIFVLNSLQQARKPAAAPPKGGLRRS